MHAEAKLQGFDIQKQPQMHMHGGPRGIHALTAGR